MSKLPKVLQALFRLIFIDQIYLTATFPLITLIFFDTNSHLFPTTTTTAVRSFYFGICVALPNAINLCCAPLLGLLSDHWGRKKILCMEITGAVAYAYLVGIGILLHSVTYVFFAFALRGAFARTNPTALAIVGDVADKNAKVYYMGMLQFAISLGAMIGPIIGGYGAKSLFFNDYNYALPFFIAGCLALLNLILTILTLPETHHHRTTSLHWRGLQELIHNKNIILLAIILLSIQFSWSNYYQFMPPILKLNFQFTAHQLGWFIGMVAAWLAITTGLIIKPLALRCSMQQMLSLACYLIIIGLITTILAIKFAVLSDKIIWIAAAPIAAGDVLSYSCLTALLSNSVAQHKQGKAMGLSFLIVGLVWASTSFLGGILMKHNPLLPLYISPIGVLFAIFLIKHPISRKTTEPQPIAVL